MHSEHLAGSIAKVPAFSKIALFGHCGSQAEQPVHCEIFEWEASWETQGLLQATWCPPCVVQLLESASGGDLSLCIVQGHLNWVS